MVIFWTAKNPPPFTMTNNGEKEEMEAINLVTNFPQRGKHENDDTAEESG